MGTKLMFPKLSEKIIQAFYTVYARLGYGFLEKVYEKALMIELSKISLCAVAQAPITVLYDGVNIGDYFADVIVEE